MFRLKELRQESGMRRSELAKQLNINAGTIANYENEIRQAPYEYLILFAEYFEVSIDYLLGREEKSETRVKIEGPLNETERQIIDDYRNCSPTGKSRIREYASLWKNSSI